MFDWKDYLLSADVLAQLDPAKEVPIESLEVLVEKSPHAIIVAGTQDVTEGNAVKTIELANRKTEAPIYFAPSHPNQVGEQIIDLIRQDIVRGLIIYHPLNSKNKKIANWPKAWYAEIKQKDIGEIIEDKFLGDYCINIGYIVTNPNSAVGKFLKPQLSRERVIGCAKLCPLGILYLDGSGKAVSPNLINAVRKNFNGFLIVGGGLETYNDVKKAFDSGANAIVVGTILEKGNIEGYKNTVAAAKNIKK